jgi:carotenoid cleavage dioxygenase-like enzyme
MEQAIALSRRAALQLLGVGGMVGAASFCPSAFGATPENAWHSSFAPFDSRPGQPPAERLQTDRLSVEGRWPQELRGTFYRNGPARMRLGTTAYHHWFDGDGMLQAFHLGPDHASHKGVLLRTPKREEEDTAGHFVRTAFGTAIADAQPLRAPDQASTANINVLAMRGGRDLYALWEGGSALQIDPRTLDTRGFKAWSAETAGAPFSAHPRTAPDGTVWSFGYMPGSGRLVLYEIATNGRLARQKVIDAPQADMVHDFAVTERHLVFLLMPLEFTRHHDSRAPFIDRYRWEDDAPLVVLVVDKTDWRVRRFELPNSGLFHLGNAWMQGNTIRLAYVRHGRILESMRRMDIGRSAPNTGPEQATTEWTHVAIDLAAGTARQEGSGLRNVEFPCHDPRRNGDRSQLAVLLQRGPHMNPAVHAMDTVVVLAGDQLQRYTYEEGFMAEEHIYVPHPRRADERSGWVLGTSYHWPTERTTLSVFAASRVADGPLAQVRLPYGLPLGLHGQFVPG